MLIELDAEQVAQRLGLGAAYTTWLEFLEAVGPPPAGVPVLGTGAEEVLLQRVGLTEPDLGEILATLPSPAGQPELWWLLQRTYHAVLRDIGQPGAIPSRPSLPAELGASGRCFWLWVYLAAVPDLRRWHRAQRIDDDVSWKTLADLGRHTRLHRRRKGNVGFVEQFWLSLHFRAELFELGRLQFNPHLLAAGPADALGDGVRAGDPALGVHIPQSGPLTPAACDASFEAAREFFARLYPTRSYRVATCTSWLMDEQLLEYLDADTNIARFQQRFTLVPGARDADYSPLLFVFDKEPSAIDEIVPHTRLEHAIINHLAAGKHWHMRTGALRL